MYLYMIPGLTGLKKASQDTLKMLNLINPFSVIPVSAYPSRLLMTLMNQTSVFWLPLVSVMEMPIAVACAPQRIWSCHLEIAITRVMLEAHVEGVYMDEKFAL